jgi:hypothetical protein
MNKHLFIILFGGFIFSTYAADDLIKNGDFEKGKTRWSGDLKVEFETADKTNKICRIELDKKDSVTFNQKVSTSGSTTSLILRYKVRKSSDYEGYEHFNIHAKGNNGAISSKGQKVPVNMEWNPMELKIPEELYKERTIKILFHVLPGNSGFLFFDDIELLIEHD